MKRQCHASQIDYFAIMSIVNNLIITQFTITQSVSVVPKDSIIMRLACI